MAVIFKQQQQDDTIEVRTAGNTVRLYSNGVLHSQYNPNYLISGAIWDLLVLPGFFLKVPPKRVLVLGLGGGTVVHLIRHFFPECEIVCIERESLHIKIAKRFFNIPKNVTIIQGDAYAELKKLRMKFDWVLDDVFQHVSGEPERDTEFSDVFELYEKVLTKNAVLSMNTIGSAQLKQIKAFRSRFDSAYVLRHPLYDNAIVSFFNNGRTKLEFNSKILKFKELDARRKTCRLNATLRFL